MGCSTDPRDEGEDGDKWPIVSKDLSRIRENAREMYEGYVRSITQFRTFSLPSASFVSTVHEAVCVLLILYVDLPCPSRHITLPPAPDNLISAHAGRATIASASRLSR